MAIPKNKLVAAMSAIVLTSLLAACSGSQPNAAGNPPAKDAAPPQETPPAVFKVFFDFNIDPEGMSLSSNEYIDFLQKKTGVRVELESSGSSAYMDKLNILIASGSYPDAFQVYDRNILFQYAKDGLLEDLAPHLDKYPNIKKNMPAEAWLPVTDNGKIWGFPYNRQDGLNQVAYVNKAWLDKLNLGVPKTLDEFYNVMKAFTDNDPDGNGKKDTFGLVANRNQGYGGRMFRAAYDAESYKIIDGQVTPPEITDNYKEYLKYMARLTKEGILDPEWATAAGSIFQQMVNKGKYGAFSGFWHFKSGKEFGPNVMDPYIAIAPPLHPDGSPTKFTYTTTNRHYIAIPKTTKNIDHLLGFFDWALSDEGTKFTYLGVEDIHYKTDNGKIALTDKRPHGIHWAFSLVKHGQLNDEVLGYLKYQFSEDVVENLSLSTQSGTIDKLAASLPYYEELSNFNLGKITEEYTNKAILGNVDIDKTWDDYVKRYLASGGTKAIEFWTEWYNKEGKNIVK